MATVLWIILAIVIFLIWILCKLIRRIIRKLEISTRNRKRASQEARREAEYAAAQERIAIEKKRFEASIEKTSIVNTHKIFDSNRKYHFETTFMVYFKNNTKKAITVLDGSNDYDIFLSKVEE